MQAALSAMGLDAALFGRMVTSDVASQGHAAIHVAHAITTHAGQNESDYLAAVDTLDPDTGAGTLQSIQLTTGVFYNYLAIDVPLLLSNLEGVATEDWQTADPTLAKDVIARMIRSAAMTSPGAKLGSTAPYAFSNTVLTEVGNTQPCQLVNAFLKPVSLNSDDIGEDSCAQLVKEAATMERMYEMGNERRFASVYDAQHATGEVYKSVAKLAKDTAEAIA